jgi:hypothetical protein
MGLRAWGRRLVVSGCWAACLGSGLGLAACEECICIEDDYRPWGDAPRECRFVDGEAYCVLEGESCPGGGNEASASSVCDGNTVIACVGPYVAAKTECSAAALCTESDAGTFCKLNPLEFVCEPGLCLCGEGSMWACCGKDGQWHGNGCLGADDNCRVLEPGQGCFLDASVIDADADVLDGQVGE